MKKSNNENLTYKESKILYYSLGCFLIILGVTLFIVGEFINNILFYMLAFLTFILAYYALKQVYHLNVKYNMTQIDLKNKFMTPLVKEVFTNARFEPYYYISEDEFIRSEFSRYGTDYKCQDSIIGEVDGIKFDCSDILYQKIDSNGKYDERTVLFNGIFIRILDNKQLNAKVKISEKENLAYNLKDYQKIETESIEFNKRFNLYTTDSELAFYLANPKYISNLIKLEKQVKGDFYLLYKNGLIYLLIDRTNLSFELKENEEYSDELKKEFLNYLEQIKKIIKIIKS